MNDGIQIFRQVIIYHIMNNKTIRNSILNKVSERINPISANIHYQNQTCGTCIAKNKGSSRNLKKNNTVLEKELNGYKNRLTLCRKICNVIICKPKSQLEIKNTNHQQQMMISHHLKQQINQQISVDTKQLFISIEENALKIRQTLMKWLNHMINYIRQPKPYQQATVLPYQEFMDLQQYKNQCYDRIDIYLDMLMRQKTSEKQISPQMNSCQIIKSGTTLASSQKYIGRNNNSEEQMRLIYIQALSLQNFINKNAQMETKDKLIRIQS